MIQKEEYIFRINKVIDYIDSNIESELTLEDISRIANFSPFHFHRIFKSIVGESLNKYIQRIRIEKAASQLIYYPTKSITEIAYDCGFSSSQFFARVFKEYFTISARDWRAKHLKNSKKIHINSKKIEEISIPSDYHLVENKQRDKILIQSTVEVKTIPDMYLAYIRHIGSYKGDANLFKKLFSKLFKWAYARDLMNLPETKVIALYNDNPSITDENKLRTMVCITIPEDTKVDRDVGKMKLIGGKYAVAHFELGKDEFQKAWDFVYCEWLPESGFTPDDKPAFELFLNDPEQHPQKKSIFDIYLPVKPL